MGKKNKPNKYPPKQQPQPAVSISHSPSAPTAVATNTPPPDPIVSTAAAIERLHAEALEQATEDDLEKATAAEPLADATEGASGKERVEKAVKAAEEARALFRAQEERARQAEEDAREKLMNVGRREADVLERENRLQSRLEELDARESKLTAQEETRRQEYAQLAKREATLTQREEDLVRREIDAQAGFSAQRREALSKLQAEARSLDEHMSKLRTELVAERAGWEVERSATEKAHRERMRQEEARFEEKLREEEAKQRAMFELEKKQLDEERKTLHEKHAQLERERRQLGFDRDEVAEHKRDLEQRVEQRSAAQKERFDFAQRCIQEQLEVARAERNRLNGELERRREADRRFGHRMPEEVLAELETLTRERDSLLAQLATRPDANAMARLQRIDAERERWEAERLRVMQENQELRSEVARCRIAVTEIETLRDQKAALESSRALLHGAIEELRKDVDDRVRNAAAATVFPECSLMDADSAYQVPVAREERIPSLAAFTEDIRRRMASDPDPRNRRYYRPEDVRCFLGGLAASRLLLLQGISGTGKTSLPIAFSRAVGGEVKVISVQAGWRDKQDLIGHYNSFERKYHESELLRTLYAAQCPRYDDVIYVVVLDEMNLSHPEHYFADFLSALEQQSDMQDVELAASLEPPLPKLLRGGRRLVIPRNVWFVGTANHDETTKDFADKTYDRGHVMELPRKPEPFEPTAPRARPPIAFRALEAAFDEAGKTHQAEAKRAYRFLTEKLGDLLADRFRVGWGNRLERQMDAFVPVVLAASGSIGEATDHILATKLLRKIKDRHDMRADDLVALRNRLDEAWKGLDPKHQPIQSRTLIKEELKRLGNAEEVA